MALADDIRRYWDADAATYDLSPGHRPPGAMARAAWLSALERFLPPAPSSVLDCGAGTGFLSLMAARLGHRVTALDLSDGMLGRLRAAAGEEGLAVTVVEGPAESPPPGPFDVVMERHLLWTLPDPGGALAAWRASAPGGRLLLVESLWGSVDPVERLRSDLRHRLRRARRLPPEHHAPYTEAMRSALPLGGGTDPAVLIDLVGRAGWGRVRLERLRDVEWAERRDLPPVERLVGVAPRLVLRADAVGA